MGGFSTLHLGLPLGNNPKQMSFWMEDKVKSLLASWKRSSFSKGGRLTLIHSILNGISNVIYFFSLFRPPCLVCKSLEKLMKNSVRRCGGGQTSSLGELGDHG